uniref:Uncharacterized protein n=1 Tax=Panagrolaimus sp. ES5 TaxID=591445 RepID=A0AC34GIS7_9BILA
SSENANVKSSTNAEQTTILQNVDESTTASVTEAQNVSPTTTESSSATSDAVIVPIVAESNQERVKALLAKALKEKEDRESTTLSESSITEQKIILQNVDEITTASATEVSNVLSTTTESSLETEAVVVPLVAESNKARVKELLAKALKEKEDNESTTVSASEATVIPPQSTISEKPVTDSQTTILQNVDERTTKTATDAIDKVTDATTVVSPTTTDPLSTTASGPTESVIVPMVQESNQARVKELLAKAL